MGRQVKPKGKVNRENKWIIPKIEIKPTRTYGEVTEGRKAAQKASKKMKSMNPSRDAKIEAFRKSQGWA